MDGLGDIFVGLERVDVADVDHTWVLHEVTRHATHLRKEGRKEGRKIQKEEGGVQCFSTNGSKWLKERRGRQVHGLGVASRKVLKYTTSSRFYLNG